MPETTAIEKINCPVCLRKLNKSDLKEHLQIFHQAEYEASLGLKKEKALRWANRNNTDPPIKHRLPHNITMKWLKLKEEALPKSIRFSILAFDIDKASGKSGPDLLMRSTEISEKIELWKEDKENWQGPPPLRIIQESERLLKLLETSAPDSPLPNAITRPYGILAKAKSFADLILNEIERLQYIHRLDTIGKLAGEKIVETEAAEIREPFISPMEPDLKTQYAELLKKNMGPVVEHIKKERERMINAIHAYCAKNSTSVFSYTYDEVTGEVTGSVGETTKVSPTI